MDHNTKTLLIIGNGFDLAHDMKTGYKDVLKHIVNDIAITDKRLTQDEQMKCFSETLDGEITKKLLKLFKGIYEEDYSLRIKTFDIEKLNGDLTGAYQFAIDYLKLFNNIWFQYFMDVLQDRNRRLGEGWVDFEAEIHRVVLSIERILLGQTYEQDIEKILSGYIGDLVALREQFIPMLRIDLMILSTIMEFVLSKAEGSVKKKPLPIIESLNNVKALLSYNYTHTYQKIYDTDLNSVCYLHGEITEHNLVLGTDETLSDEQKDDLLDCASFKKIYQLIYYRLGNKFKKVLNCLGEGPWEGVIYGHSLTPADKYSLKWLFEKSETNDYFFGKVKKYTIYYLKDDDYNKQLANLFQLIGQEKVLEYTSDGTISFVRVPSEEKEKTEDK